MYKLILFDADGTLFDYNRAEKFALEKALLRSGYKDSLINIRERYRDINFRLWKELECGTILKDQLRTERFKRLFTEYNLTYNVDDFSDYYLEKLGEASFLIDGAEEICKSLSDQYRLVILTNGIKKVQLSRLNGSVIKSYISDIVISEEVGVNKPHPAIFEYTLNRLNFKEKERVLMVGDSLSSDIQGGINFGIDTCWFNPGKIGNKTKTEPKFCIDSLGQLKDLL